MVATNGVRLDEARAQWLAEQRFRVQLSLDGAPASHDATRRFADGRSSREATEAAARALVRANVRPVAAWVVDPHNVAFLPDGLDHLLSLGLRDIHLEPNYSGAWTEAACTRLEECVPLLADRYAAARGRGMAVRLAPFEALLQTARDPGLEAHRCNFGRDELAVAPSGRLYPCERMVREDDGATSIGTLETGVDEGRLQVLRQGVGDPDEECAACPLVRRCARFCGCANHETTGSPRAVSAVQCWFNRVFAREADRLVATQGL